MTTTYVHRRTNLRSLAAQHGGASALASEVGLTKGRLSQLIGSKPVGEVGERIARRIEAQLGLPSGWLDRQPEDANCNATEVAVDVDEAAQRSQEALKHLRSNLLRLMSESNIGQSELARRTRMTPRAINRLVAPPEDAHSPTLDTLQALALGLNTTVAALVSPGFAAPAEATGVLRTSPSLAKQAGRLVEDFLLASEEDRRILLAQAAEAADRAAEQ